MSELLKLQDDQALVHPAQCVLGGGEESCCRHDGPIPAPVESRRRVRLVGRTKTTGITSPAGGESCSVRRSAREGRGGARESQERRVPPLVPVTPSPSGRAPHLLPPSPSLPPPPPVSLSAQGGFHLPPPDALCGAAGEGGGGGGELSPAPPAAAAAAAAASVARPGRHLRAVLQNVNVTCMQVLGESSQWHQLSNVSRENCLNGLEPRGIKSHPDQESKEL